MFLLQLIQKALPRKLVQRPGSRGGKFHFSKKEHKIRYGKVPHSVEGFFIDKKHKLKFGRPEVLGEKQREERYREGVPSRNFVSGEGAEVRKQDLKTIQRNIEAGAKNLKTIHIAYTTKDGDIKMVRHAEPKSYRGDLFYFINPSGFDPTTNKKGRVLRSFKMGNILAVHPGGKNYQNDPKYPVEIGRNVKKSNESNLVYSTNFNNIVGMAKKRGMGIRDILRKVGPRTHKDRRDFVLKVGRAMGLQDREAIRVGKKVGTINKSN